MPLNGTAWCLFAAVAAVRRCAVTTRRVARDYAACMMTACMCACATGSLVLGRIDFIRWGMQNVDIVICTYLYSRRFVRLPRGGGGAGVSEQAAVGTKRRAAEVEAAAAADDLTDSQKKALMTRKQRKMFEGARKREDAKAERVAKLQAKKAALKAQ